MILLTTIVTALMTYAFSASKTLRDQRAGRTMRTSADAALDAGVAMVKEDKTLGVTTSPGTCSLKIPIQQTSIDLEVNSGSYLVLTCAATTGISPESGSIDPAENAQRSHDVTFTVTCNQTIVAGKVNCGAAVPGTTTPRVVGKARIRYDIDYAYDGSTPLLPSDARARVPKVVFWTTRA